MWWRPVEAWIWPVPWLSSLCVWFTSNVATKQPPQPAWSLGLFPFACQQIKFPAFVEGLRSRVVKFTLLAVRILPPTRTGNSRWSDTESDFPILKPIRDPIYFIFHLHCLTTSQIAKSPMLGSLNLLPSGHQAFFRVAHITHRINSYFASLAHNSPLKFFIYFTSWLSHTSLILWSDLHWRNGVRSFYWRWVGF